MNYSVDWDGPGERERDPAALETENTKLRAALREMLDAYSMENVGLEASKRRLAAKKTARSALED